MIPISPQLAIREEELSFTASRSGGPGGQNVNKVNTRVTLWFDVAGSSSLSAEQKQMLLTRLANRMTKDGVLQIVCQQHRTQPANRQAAIDRFVEMVRRALARPKPRHPTRATYSSRQARLETKRRRGDIKRLRSRPDL